MISKCELEEEEKKLRYLRFLVDLTVVILMQGNLSIAESLNLIKRTKQCVLKLFPDKEDTYNLIYKPRFERIIKELLEKN